MSVGRMPQNLLILLYKIKNNEVSLNMVNGGGGGRGTRDLWRTRVISIIRWYYLSNITHNSCVLEWVFVKQSLL